MIRDKNKLSKEIFYYRMRKVLSEKACDILWKVIHEEPLTENEKLYYKTTLKPKLRVMEEFKEIIGEIFK